MEAECSTEQRNNLGLFNAITELKKDLRLVIVLHYIEGFRTKEMADILKISEGTVKSRLSRARTELKYILGEMEVMFNEQ
jgi:RNA polymerase sigma-70 factor (ECF subfamily)